MGSKSRIAKYQNKKNIIRRPLCPTPQPQREREREERIVLAYLPILVFFASLKSTFSMYYGFKILSHFTLKRMWFLEKTSLGGNFLWKWKSNIPHRNWISRLLQEIADMEKKRFCGLLPHQTHENLILCGNGLHYRALRRLHIHQGK